MSSNHLTESLLDLNADHYAKNSLLQNNLAKEILDAYHINPDSCILDVGCGDGRITAEIAQRAYKGTVLGVDASTNMIEFALKSFPKNKFPNLTFLQGMAEEIQIPREMDLIVSFSCFHWLKNPRLVIRKLYSSLKKGGEMIILTYPQESHYYQYLQRALKNYPHYYPLSANHTMLTSCEYKDVLLKNSFEIVEFKQRELTALYSSLEEVQDYIRGWLNSYVPLPEHLHSLFLQDVSQVILKDPTVHQGNQIVLPYTALVIKAQKR